MAGNSSPSPDTTIDPVLGHQLPRRKAERPAPLDAATLDPASLQPLDQHAKIHIQASGEVLIDLTDGDTAPTTDIVCPNCGGSLRVGSVDTDIRAADMECQDCQFRFVQRLRLRADDRLASAAAAEPGRRGRFLRSRRSS